MLDGSQKKTMVTPLDQWLHIALKAPQILNSYKVLDGLGDNENEEEMVFIPAFSQ
jgi:hypothetical protein